MRFSPRVPYGDTTTIGNIFTWLAGLFISHCRQLPRCYYHTYLVRPAFLTRCVYLWNAGKPGATDNKHNRSVSTARLAGRIPRCGRSKVFAGIAMSAHLPSC